jgi:hypothetical protein
LGGYYARGSQDSQNGAQRRNIELRCHDLISSSAFGMKLNYWLPSTSDAEVLLPLQIRSPQSSRAGERR